MKFYVDNRNLEVAWEKETATNLGILVSLVGGEKELKLLAKTISDLKQIAKSKGYILDLHDGNFLLGGDGEIGGGLRHDLAGGDVEIARDIQIASSA